jgi:hypothetical protein
MPSFRTGTVATVLSERPGLQRVLVDLDGEQRRAYVLTRLIGPVIEGQRVVVNTTATDLDLGTGGWDVVHWNLDRDSWSEVGPGHVLKLRYTSLQIDTGVAEEEAGYAEAAAAGLAGMPVVACFLHSQVAAVAAAFKHVAPGRRLAYVMTDGGALPLALSDLMAGLCSAGLVDLTVTTGQAFGGMFEAVNVESGLEVARHAGHADAVVVGTGPGVVGTGTRHGFSALEVAGIVDFAARDGGRPILALRWSDADPRPRHRGISHHAIAALEYAHASAVVPIPRGREGPEPGRHQVVEVDVPDVPALLAAAGLTVTTMGRGADTEPGFFAYAGAAGVAAALAVC